LIKSSKISGRSFSFLKEVIGEFCVNLFHVEVLLEE